jgi:hypothetical protein
MVSTLTSGCDFDCSGDALFIVREKMECLVEQCFFVTGFILLPGKRVRASLYCPCSLPEASLNLIFFPYLRQEPLSVQLCIFSVLHITYTLLLSSRPCFRCYRVLYSSKPICCCCCYCCCEHNRTVSFLLRWIGRADLELHYCPPTLSSHPSVSRSCSCWLKQCFNQDNPPDFCVLFLPFSQTGNFAQEKPHCHQLRGL